MEKIVTMFILASAFVCFAYLAYEFISGFFFAFREYRREMKFKEKFSHLYCELVVEANVSQNGEYVYFVSSFKAPEMLETPDDTWRICLINKLDNEEGDIVLSCEKLIPATCQDPIPGSVERKLKFWLKLGDIISFDERKELEDMIQEQNSKVSDYVDKLWYREREVGKKLKLSQSFWER